MLFLIRSTQVPDGAAAKAFSAGDPFGRHGLFSRVIITRFLDITRGKPAFGATPA